MDVIAEMKKRVGDIESAMGLDWRFSYSDVEIKGEKSFRLELSREDVFQALKNDPPPGMIVVESDERSFKLSDGEGMNFEVRLLIEPADSVLLVISSVADIRRGPDHASELLSQAIMGEELLKLKRKGEWLLCRYDDGYTGWVRSWYVKDVSAEEFREFNDRCNVMVVANVGYVYSEPSDASLPVSDAVAGTKLRALDCEGGFCEVELPGGKKGFIKEHDIERLSAGRRPSRDAIVQRALRFLGIPYLWGGTSAKGFDCSGLIKRVFSMEGISLPRDSDMQAKVGELIPLDRLKEAEKADLLFFGEGGKVSHVALYLGDMKFLHAYGEVRLNSLSAGSSDYDEKLAGSLLFARKIL